MPRTVAVEVMPLSPAGSDTAPIRADHFSSPRVAVNIDLAVCIAVTSDW